MYQLDKCANPECTRTGSVALEPGDKFCNLCKSKKKDKKEEKEEELE
jgi:hypothetical protein